MWDVIVIGAGIVGATVAQAMRKQGRTVLLLDDARPLSGTRPSGGHVKPDWCSGMHKNVFNQSLSLLDDVWGIAEEQFRFRTPPLLGGVTVPWATTTVYRVDTDKVVHLPEKIQATAKDLDHLDNYPLVRYLPHAKGAVYEEARCRLLVVAAGVWVPELLPEFRGQLKAKQGVSFRVTGQLEEPFIQPWAPYKQIVAHQQTQDTIWVGDGTAILPENWNNARTHSCMERCRKALGMESLVYPVSHHGLRPYAQPGILTKDEPCLYRALSKRAYVVTAAGKLGTIAAGWAAHRLMDATS